MTTLQSEFWTSCNLLNSKSVSDKRVNCSSPACCSPKHSLTALMYSGLVGVTGREGELSWEARAEEVSFEVLPKRCNRSPIYYSFKLVRLTTFKLQGKKCRIKMSRWGFMCRKHSFNLNIKS